MIKVSGGTLGGRVLRAPVPEGVRPTSIRTRAALFSMLGQDLSGWSFLDACGGTGLMAVEAASRGAAPVFVADRDALALAGIEQNLGQLGLARVRVLRGDVRRPQEPALSADVVFLDPPYKDPIGPWIAWASGVARRYVVAEARFGTEWPEPAEGFERDGVRRHGEAELALYRRLLAPE
ncbi:MAG: 16S rRNA (guanine(966)-N(2))-methyltransferase RsmD [Myxococcales bacterium]|nr:16S rRNA (guanine(966)-N(2))-methyltransferase RsmD [Myxococcales bacterium]